MKRKNAASRQRTPRHAHRTCRKEGFERLSPRPRFTWSLNIKSLAQLQSRARHVLCRGLQLDVRGTKFNQRTAHGAVGQFGPITIAAQMRQIESLEVRRDNLLGQYRSGFIGEMSVPAENALLDTPGAVQVLLQQLHVMIGFQQQHGGRAYALDDQLCRVAQIRQEPEIGRVRVDQKADRIVRVMGNAKRIDLHVAHFKRGARAEEANIETSAGLQLDRFLRQTIAVNGDSQLAGDHCQTLNVIGMFVRHEDPIDPFRRAANAEQALADLPSAQARVNQEAGLVGFKVSAVAAGTTAEYGETNRHERS
jgi:hypothetical protein